jgi:hypothetical protein
MAGAPALRRAQRRVCSDLMLAAIVAISWRTGPVLFPVMCPASL